MRECVKAIIIYAVKAIIMFGCGCYFNNPILFALACIFCFFMGIYLVVWAEDLD